MHQPSGPSSLSIVRGRGSSAVARVGVWVGAIRTGVAFARTSRGAHGTVRIQRTTWKKNTSIVNGNSVIIK
jgi:hypothetical protein